MKQICIALALLTVHGSWTRMHKGPDLSNVDKIIISSQPVPNMLYGTGILG